MHSMARAHLHASHAASGGGKPRLKRLQVRRLYRAVQQPRADGRHAAHLAAHMLLGFPRAAKGAGIGAQPRHAAAAARVSRAVRAQARTSASVLLPE